MIILLFSKMPRKGKEAGPRVQKVPRMRISASKFVSELDMF
jgi:hypothetical protein